MVSFLAVAITNSVWARNIKNKMQASGIEKTVVVL